MSQSDINALALGKSAGDLHNNMETILAAGIRQAIGNINNPILDLPLRNSLTMRVGAGAVTFTRASTGTYIDRFGVVKTAAANEPRFEAAGLLIEGGSTNLITNSADVTAWSQVRVTTTANAATAPDGTVTADKVSATGEVDPFISRTITPGGSLANRTFTYSIWLWTDAGQPVDVGLYLHGLTALESMTIKNVTITATPQRFEVATGFGPAAVSTGITVRVDLANPTQAGQYLFAWGAQLEEMPFATSYIPTAGSAVTRAAEICTVQAIGNLPAASSPHTLLADIDLSGDDTRTSSSQNVVRISGESIRNLYAKGWGTESGASNAPSGGVSQGTFSYDTVRRLGYRYSEGSLNLILDGAIIKTGSADGATGTPNAIKLGSDGTTNHLYGHLSNLRIYDRALTDTELALA